MRCLLPGKRNIEDEDCNASVRSCFVFLSYRPLSVIEHRGVLKKKAKSDRALLILSPFLLVLHSTVQ